MKKNKNFISILLLLEIQTHKSKRREQAYLFLIFLDLFTKFIAKNFLDTQINIIKDLFFLEFVKNP